MKSWRERLAEQQQIDVKNVSMGLGIFVYLAALLYAGVRSFSLFKATIAPELLWLAGLGVVTMEFSALALPLAIHFATAPGTHRQYTYGFYVVDLAVLIFNSILDAGHHSGTILPGFLNGYGIYFVPALPVIGMIGWALFWILDPETKRQDGVRAIQQQMRDKLVSNIETALEQADFTNQVVAAAQIGAQALLDEALDLKKLQPPTAPSPSVSAQTQPLVTSFAADTTDAKIEVSPAKGAKLAKNQTGGTAS